MELDDVDPAAAAATAAIAAAAEIAEMKRLNAEQAEKIKKLEEGVKAKDLEEKVDQVMGAMVNKDIPVPQPMWNFRREEKMVDGKLVVEYPELPSDQFLEATDYIKVSPNSHATVPPDVVLHMTVNSTVPTLTHVANVCCVGGSEYGRDGKIYRCSKKDRIKDAEIFRYYNALDEHMDPFTLLQASFLMRATLHANCHDGQLYLPKAYWAHVETVFKSFTPESFPVWRLYNWMVLDLMRLSLTRRKWPKVLDKFQPDLLDAARTRFQASKDDLLERIPTGMFARICALPADKFFAIRPQLDEYNRPMVKGKQFPPPCPSFLGVTGDPLPAGYSYPSPPLPSSSTTVGMALIDHRPIAGLPKSGGKKSSPPKEGGVIDTVKRVLGGETTTPERILLCVGCVDKSGTHIFQHCPSLFERLHKITLINATGIPYESIRVKSSNKNVCQPYNLKGSCRGRGLGRKCESEHLCTKCGADHAFVNHRD